MSHGCLIRRIPFEFRSLHAHLKFARWAFMLWRAWHGKASEARCGAAGSGRARLGRVGLGRLGKNGEAHRASLFLTEKTCLELRHRRLITFVVFPEMTINIKRQRDI